MPTAPLAPFAGPSVMVATGPLIGGALAIAFAFWMLYTTIAIYHWIKYSHAATVAFPAIVIHLGVSGLLILFTLSGLL